MTITPVSKHPAKFSPEILARIADLIDDYGWPLRILDPFAGVGRVHGITASRTYGVEIEPEWAANTPNTIAGNALHLPFLDATFDGMVTSPCYGNRFSDSHKARDSSERRSYTHDLRAGTEDPERDLHPDNAGTLPWGPKYRAFHDRAWTEALRTLTPASPACPQGALIIVNVSNFYKTIKGQITEQHVAEWHHNWFLDHGCAVVDFDAVSTKRFKKGANREQRATCEYLFVLRYVAPVLTPDSDEEISDDVDQRPHTSHRPGVADRVDAADGGRSA